MTLEQKVETEEMVVVNVDNMVKSISNTIESSISRIDEINKTKPKINFHLGRDSNEKLVLLSSVSFPNELSTISPMEYTEKLIAMEMIKVVVRNKMNI